MPRSLFCQDLLDSDLFLVYLVCMGGFGFPLGSTTRLDRESENIMDLLIFEFLIMSSTILIACKSFE